MKVEIWSDVVCPFCYIGKRHFEAALAQFPDTKDIEISWKSFQLDPSVSAQEAGQTHMDYLAKKRGWSMEQTREALGSVTNMAAASGLDYKLEHTKVVNTFNAHRLLQFASAKGLGDQAEELFFKAYFTEEKDIADEAVQLEIFEKLGLTPADRETALQDEQYAKAAHADIAEARQIGVNGVPFFVFDRKYAISGAQPVEAFLQTLTQSHSEWREKNPEIKLDIQSGPSCDINGNCN